MLILGLNSLVAQFNAMNPLKVGQIPVLALEADTYVV